MELAKAKLQRGIWIMFRFLLIAGLSFILLFPLMYMLSSALRPAVSVNDPTVIWVPKSLTLENIKMAAKAMSYWTSFKSTLMIGVVSTMLQLVSCALAGYGFARFKFKGKPFFFALVILTIIVPPQTIILSSFINFKFFDFFGILRVWGWIAGQHYSVNLTNTPWTFYLPSLLGMGIRSGLYIFIFRQFFMGLPQELNDAAKIDGCGAFHTFAKVMVPNAGAAFLTVFLFSIVWHWNDYFLSAMYFMSDFPLSVALTQIRSGLQIVGVGAESVPPDQMRTYLQAGCLITILPILVLYIFLQKHFTESIERTGIVG